MRCLFIHQYTSFSRHYCAHLCDAQSLRCGLCGISVSPFNQPQHYERRVWLNKFKQITFSHPFWSQRNIWSNIKQLLWVHVQSDENTMQIYIHLKFAICVRLKPHVAALWSSWRAGLFDLRALVLVVHNVASYCDGESNKEDDDFNFNWIIGTMYVWTL